MEMYVSTLLMYAAASPSTLVLSTYLLTSGIRPGKSSCGREGGREREREGERGREKERGRNQACISFLMYL